MASPGAARIIQTHRYRLCREFEERDDGTFVCDAIVISMGEHGAMLASPETVGRIIPGLSETGERQSMLAGQNIAEMKRAMEEGGKWEMRLKASPLGKTQQDFVAFYGEVIALFTNWCIARGIPIPR